jgi:hypothetical protein
MPYEPQENRHPHLRLIAEDRSHDRRKRPAPPTPAPPRGSRPVFAAKLTEKLDELEEQLERATVASPGIQPHLVFRIPLAKGVVVDEIGKILREVGLIPVSIEPDRAVIAFRSEADLTDFKLAVDAYRHGPGMNPKTGQLFKSTKWDKFEYIEADSMALWSRADRVGPLLRREAGNSAENLDARRQYIVDIELWHRGTRDLALASLQEVRTVVQQANRQDDRILDSFVGENLCLARVSVSGNTLSNILNLQAIAEADFPPQPFFNATSASQVTARDYPPPVAPAPNGPRVCIVDSGIAENHPLLASNVGHSAAVLSSTVIAADEHGHGTMVAGLSVFGNIRACYSDGLFTSPITLFSARVLDQNNQFDSEKLIVNQIRDAVSQFQRPPHNCRVFNLSLGTSQPAFVDGLERQTVWAESLDILARELKILLVVSAGNFSEIFGWNTDEAERVLHEYPNYLLQHSATLNDPATAAIPITVGAISEHDVVATRTGIGVNDISRPIAGRNHPSPFTRIGHGIGGAIKPEFVEYGGNAVFSGTGNMRRIVKEPGTAVMSFSHVPFQRLFSYDVGTSLAAPVVSRNAALVWHSLEINLGVEPDPNLVRAVMATAASVPEELKTVIRDQNDQFRTAGYGWVDSDFALSSSDRHVTLVAQGTLALDKFAIYAVPITPNLTRAQGRKKIRVALAFEPPVRRRRMDYLGVEMTFQMVRGKSLEQVISAYEAVRPDEEPDAALGSPYRISFIPKESSRNGGYKRKKSTLQLGEFTFQRDTTPYGDTYWLIVRSERKWAPIEIESQDYAVAVVLIAEDDELYNSVALRLQQRTRIRARR